LILQPPHRCLICRMVGRTKSEYLMHNLVRQHLLHAQDRMKRQVDKGCSDHSFSEGDLVFLELQPYVQSLVAQLSSQKLSFKFFSLFLISHRVGAAAFSAPLDPSSSLLSWSCFRCQRRFCSIAGRQAIISWCSVWSSDLRCRCHCPPRKIHWKQQFPRALAQGHVKTQAGKCHESFSIRYYGCWAPDN
jgi:hypothetical protein